MKFRAGVLIISIFSLYLAACQAEPEPTPTLEPFEWPETLDGTSEAPTAGDENESQPPTAPPDEPNEDPPTEPPQPPPTITPSSNINNEAPGSGGAPEGGSETPTFTNVTINNGAYEGAILESQIATGGGGGYFRSCMTSGGMQALPKDTTYETTDQMISIGCTLIDGLPIVATGVSDGTPHVGQALKPSGAQWANQPGKFVFWDFNPHENIRVVFYLTDDTGENSTLIGWQEVQVNEDGYLLLRPEFPPGVSSELLIFAAQRSNKQWIIPAFYKHGFWEEFDEDGDGLSDYYEPYYLTDPNNPDTDFDGLTDGAEFLDLGTDPNLGDTDSDGLSDGEEVNTYATDPLNPDTDSDGRLDGEEVFTYNTDPNVPDSEEATPDSDGDGLSDEEEVATYGTDPQNRDTDGDGRSDGDEVVFGTNPTTTMNADGISVVGLTNGVVFQRDYNTERGWIETTSNGNFSYQEDRRGPWGIYLDDASRDLNVHLDFWSKEISCNETVCGTIEWVSP